MQLLLAVCWLMLYRMLLHVSISRCRTAWLHNLRPSRHHRLLCSSFTMDCIRMAWHRLCCGVSVGLGGVLCVGLTSCWRLLLSKHPCNFRCCCLLLCTQRRSLLSHVRWLLLLLLLVVLLVVLLRVLLLLMLLLLMLLALSTCWPALHLRGSSRSCMPRGSSLLVRSLLCCCCGLGCFLHSLSCSMFNV
jgi:hypothetical protein